MYEPCFDYHVQVDGDTVRISVSHHAHGGNPTGVPVVFTLEVLVDLDIYERLRMANARIGVSYAGGADSATKVARPGEAIPNGRSCIRARDVSASLARSG